MDAFWAVPEWAPEGESHLVGSSSPVTRIEYGKGSVTYSTFDSKSNDVLRLDFAPESVTAAGKPLARRQDLDAEGYTFDAATSVLRIRHDSAREIDIQGQGERVPPFYVTFDDPHRPAGTLLAGEYPSGVIDWGRDSWRIVPPEGRFGTFHLAAADPTTAKVEFRFSFGRVFAGVDVYNPGTSEATLTVRSRELREMSFSIKPGELKRIPHRVA